MTRKLNVNMAEITRLTRAGRLAEAMTLLRKLSHPESADSTEPTAMEFPSRKPSFLWQHPRPGPAQTAPWLERLKTHGQLPGLDRLEHVLEPRVQVPIPDGARFEEHSYVNEAGARTFKLFIPSGYKEEPLPLLVMLHGCKQSPDDFAVGTGMNRLAEEHGFLAAYPRQPASANPMRCWNWFSPDHQLRDKGEPSLIAGITRQIMRDFAVDPARVYVAGLSAGGAAAAILGSEYPDIYAAIGVHSGLACGAANDLQSALAAMKTGGTALLNGSGRPMPAIVFHGDCDTIVSPVNGEYIITQSKGAAALSTTVLKGESAGGIAYSCTIQTDERGSPVLEQWTLHGAGHAWSGGDPAGTYTDPRGPDASREMLRFFLKHANTGLG